MFFQNLFVNLQVGLLVSSQTGSGKTLAYSLSISDEILIAKGKDPSTPSGLIITPTRELALQVYQEIQWLFEKTDLTAVITAVKSVFSNSHCISW